MYDINIVTEMNTSQMAIQQQENAMTDQVPTHRNNLRECPTKQKEWISLAVAEFDKTTGVEQRRQYSTIYPKVQAHIILTQMKIKKGLLTFGKGEMRQF